MNHSNNRMTMVAVSFVMALISIATFQIFFISLPCASVSIILALISRGDGPLLPRAKAALITAVVAAVLTTSVTAASVYTVLHNPQLRTRIEQLYDYYTDPEGSQPADGSDSSSGEDLIREILSGQYRENKQENSGDSSSKAPAGSSAGKEAGGSRSGSLTISQNGGSVI